VLWEFGDLSEEELREVLAAELFSSAAGRRSWERFRGVRIRNSERRQHRRFYDILDQEYRSAIPGAGREFMSAPSEGGSKRLITVAVWTVAATVVSAILRRVLRNLWSQILIVTNRDECAAAAVTLPATPRKRSCPQRRPILTCGFFYARRVEGDVLPTACASSPGVL
jgi:Family of unknown function (DUF6082)